jgi:hypothetical protein
MRLTLHYRGHLRANGTTAHKHELRKWFHSQLRGLWNQKPLSEQPNLLRPREGGNYSLLRPFVDFTFVPLVTAEMNAVAELSVTILRPEAPGNLLTQGGDLDNRLKTLFDALTMPRHNNAIPVGVGPINDESPHFFCLLEDDNLVTSVSVRTEQLLEVLEDTSIVDVSIYVRTRVTRSTMGNHALS